MSEAPERIGLISDGFGNWALAHRDEVDTAVHYIRADLAPSPAPDVLRLEVENSRLRDELREVVAWADELAGAIENDVWQNTQTWFALTAYRESRAALKREKSDE